MVSSREVVRLLQRFYPGNDGEAAKSQELTLALLDWSPRPFGRNVFTPGHITCTGLVLSPRRDRLLIVHHRRVNRWLLPGGHVEPGDSSIAETARREVIEETGVVLTNEKPVLVGVDVHPIPSRGREPLHLHHNMSFAFEARDLEMRASAEVRDVVWCRFEEYDQYDLPGNIRRSVSRALKRTPTWSRAGD